MRSLSQPAGQNLLSPRKTGWIFGVDSCGYVYSKDQWQVFCELGYKAPGSTNDRVFLEELDILASEVGLRSRVI